MLGMESKRPRFQNFFSGYVHAPGPSSNLHFQRSQVTPVAQVFSFSTYSKAFTTLTYLKPYQNPVFIEGLCQCE